jgi:hypothetical protein
VPVAQKMQKLEIAKSKIVNPKSQIIHEFV